MERDLGWIVSLGEVPADLVPLAKAAMRQALDAACEQWLKETDLDLTDEQVARLGALTPSVDFLR